jgi:hypothetical protein
MGEGIFFSSSDGQKVFQQPLTQFYFFIPGNGLYIICLWSATEKYGNNVFSKRGSSSISALLLGEIEKYNTETALSGTLLFIFIFHCRGAKCSSIKIHQRG